MKGVEDYSHLFFECSFSGAAWAAQKIPRVDVTVANAFRFLGLSKGCPRKIERGRLLGALWAIWLHRNEDIFKGRAVSIDGTVQDAANLVSYWFTGERVPLGVCVPCLVFYFSLLSTGGSLISGDLSSFSKNNYRYF